MLNVRDVISGVIFETIQLLGLFFLYIYLLIADNQMNSFYEAVDENGNNQIKPFTSKQFWIKLSEAANWQLMDDEM